MLYLRRVQEVKKGGWSQVEDEQETLPFSLLESLLKYQPSRGEKKGRQQKTSKSISRSPHGSHEKDRNNIHKEFSSMHPSAMMPRHIAVIMDGNRRYGKAKFSDPLQGHWEGGRTLSDFTRWCIDRKIDMLTVYAFSTENWKRDPREVGTLLRIFCKYAESMKKEAIEMGVRIRVLSTEPERLPSHVMEAIKDLEEATAGGTRFHLNLCVSYGARGEIANACKSIASLVADGSLSVDKIDESTVARHLLTNGLPDPDLVIRTSGEYRLSNFLLFQIAYAEMVFLEKFWPEVTSEDLDEILLDYVSRDRRYGQ